MILKTTAGALRSALDTVSPAVEKWAGYPILTCVLIDGRTVRACDLDMEISVSLPAEQAEGRAAIVFRRLAALVRHIPRDMDVTITADAQSATLEFDGGRYALPCVDPEGFPQIAAQAFDRLVPAAGLKAALKFVAPAISTEETRYYLNGVCFSRDRDGAQAIVATDGHRLLAYPFAGDVGTVKDAILPTSAVRALLNMPEPDSVDLGLSRFRFNWAGMTLHTKAIEGTFPDWLRVVPRFEPGAYDQIEFNRGQMDHRLVRLAATMERRQHNTAVAIAFDSSGALLSASVVDELGNGLGVERLALAGDVRSPRVVGYNARFLRQMLGTFSTESNLTVLISDDGGPMRCQGTNAKGFGILMPMRVTADGLLEELIALRKAEALAA